MTSARPLHWTAVRPTIPGWYWVEWQWGRERSRQIVQVLMPRSGAGFSVRIDGATFALGAMEALHNARRWAGPLAEPVDP